MPSTFSPSLRIELIADGEQAGVWGATTNNNLGDLLEQAITGNTAVNVTSSDATLTSLNGVVDEARSAVLVVSGTPGTTRIITIPNVPKSYTVRNNSDATVQIKTAAGVAYNCPTLSESYIYCDGSNVITGRTITDGANAITSTAAPFTSPAFLGVPTAPTAPLGTNTTQLATTAFVQSSIPVGLITLWSGSIASIPSGWALCNGSGGTPDLRDRFIVGAGSTYAVGATGGATSVTLSTANMPAHTHTGTTGSTSISHTHGISITTGGQSADHSHNGTTSTIGDHQHISPILPSGNQSPINPYGLSGSGGSVKESGNDLAFRNFPLTSSAGAHSHSFSTGGVSTGHTHLVSGTSAASDPAHTHTFTTGSTGSGTAFGILPPYYALAYIMKV